MSEERYFDATDELVPLSTRQGTRTYVMLESYVLWPKLVMTVGLYKKPKQLADTDPVIGKSLGTRQEGLREIEIGNAQAWYYPIDWTLVLWECFLESFVREKSLLKDTRMAALWYGFEKWHKRAVASAKLSWWGSDLGPSGASVEVSPTLRWQWAASRGAISQTDNVHDGRPAACCQRLINDR